MVTDPTAPERGTLREARARVSRRMREDPAFLDHASASLTAAVERALCESLREQPWPGALLVALGGTGRSDLCLHSDIDVLVLVPETPLEADGDRMRRLLDPLWAVGLRVANQVDDPRGVLERCEGDLTLLTAVLDARPLSGDLQRWVELRAGIESREPAWFQGLTDSAAAEIRVRHSRHGASTSVLEPQIKDGPGGLRDLHWLIWLARANRGVASLDALWTLGDLDDGHHRELTAAATQLRRTRHATHLLAGRNQERLTFELQEEVATLLGYRDVGGRRAVAIFLADWYRAASTVLRILRLLLWRWSGDDLLRAGPSRQVEGGPRRPECVEDVLGLVDQLCGGSPPLDPEEAEHLRSWTGAHRRLFRRRPAVAPWFRAFLGRAEVASTLFVMHEVGLLGAIVPEIESTRFQAQYSRIHRYTVDLHLLHTVAELERLTADPRVGPASEAAARTSSLAVLRMAALMHDVAKRHGTAHSRIGAEVADRVMRGLGFSDVDVSRVRWLVLHHLLLSETAYHRDLRDAQTQSELRAVVPDAHHADDLFVLTWADSRATNEEQWNGWRQAMVEEVWRAALAALVGAQGVPPRAALAAQVEALLVPELGHKRAGVLTSQLFLLMARAEDEGSGDEPDVLALIAVLLDRLEADPGTAAASAVRHRPTLGSSEWTVATADRPGVFGELAGTLTACGFAIVSATVRTYPGFAIDTFRVTDPQGRLTEDPARWRRLDRALLRVLHGEEDLGAMVDLARRHAPPPRRPGQGDQQWTRVRNDLSGQATVVEVVVPDRSGLLYDLCRILRAHELDVRVAKVATRHDLVSDTLYVVDRRGRKLSESRRKRLEGALRALAGGEDGRRSRP